MSDYSVKGDLHIEFRDANLVALVRDLPNYISRNKFLSFLDTEELAETDASQLLERILGESNFYLILSKHKLMIDKTLPGNDNYTVMHFGVSSDINVNYLDSFLAFLASLGFVVEGDFEDNNEDTWGYDSLSYNPQTKKGLVVASYFPNLVSD